MAKVVLSNLQHLVALDAFLQTVVDFVAHYYFTQLRDVRQQLRHGPACLHPVCYNVNIHGFGQG